MEQERRQFERRPLAEDIHAYIESNRLDLASLNVSAGGLFLKSDQDIPLGAAVALVFKDRSPQGEDPVFLVGRVVRRQEGTETGVGLRWEKAITSGGPDRLAAFIDELLKFRPEPIKETPGPSGQGPQWVYQFKTSTPAARVAESLAWGDSTAGSNRFGTSADLAGIGARSAEEAQDAAFEPDEPGPITNMLKFKKLRAPCDLPADLQAGGRNFAARIKELGPNGMFLQSDWQATKDAGEVVVVLDVGTHFGKSSLVCHCEVRETHEDYPDYGPGVELEILRSEEGKEAGLMKRFTRWLLYRSLAED